MIRLVLLTGLKALDPICLAKGKTKDRVQGDSSACSSSWGLRANLGAVIDFSDAMILCFMAFVNNHGAYSCADRSKREIEELFRTLKIRARSRSSSI